MKKILVPTDFSEVANNAFIHALEIANKLNAELLLIHTYEMPIIENQYTMANYQHVYDSIELSVFEEYKELVPKLHEIALSKNLEHIKFSHVIAYGEFVSNIKAWIEKEKIDLVVMGTAGAIGWKKMFLGSNAGEVISAVAVPVLCIPENVKYINIDNIGFTTRFREKDKTALRETIYFAKKLNSKIKCFYAITSNNDVSEEIIENWKKEFKNDSVTFFTTPTDDVKESILEFITSQAIDVLVMVDYKYNFFIELFSTSLAVDMTYKSDVPILVLHA